ncbi:MAG: hypothetical protein SF052_27615 [Bacteroidia bacterium]|nr:hypothetical protein [Bacteroidia bacterium]
MSDFKRLARLTKSIVPRFERGRSRYLNHDDARMMINDLGMQMSPEVLKKLIFNAEILEDFINSVYQLEQKINKEVVTEYATIDIEYNPKVYVEGHTVGFSITYKDKEVVFAEYDLEEKEDI